VMRLVRCPVGHVLIRSESSPTLDHCFPCPEGMYHLEVPTFDPPVLVSNLIEAPTLCLACPNGAECPGGAVVTPLRGFWRQPAKDDSASNVLVFRCDPDACERGGNCTPGRGGPVCGRCVSGYGKLMGACVECPGERESVGIRAIAVTVLLIIYGGVAASSVAYSSDAVLDDQSADTVMSSTLVSEGAHDGTVPDPAASSSPTGGTLVAWWRPSDESVTEAFGVLKILVATFQIFASLAAVFGLDVPPTVRRLLLGSSVLGVDLLSIYGLQCSTPADHGTRLYVLYTVFFAVLVLLALPLAAMRLLRGRWRPKAGSVMAQQALGWSFLFFPVVSRVVLATFHCHRLGSDHLLRADYSSWCPADHASAPITLAAIAGVVVFPVGVPLLASAALVLFGIPRLAKALVVRSYWLPLSALATRLTAEDKASAPTEVRSNPVRVTRLRLRKKKEDEQLSEESQRRRALGRLAGVLGEHGGVKGLDLDNMTPARLEACLMRVGKKLERMHVIQPLPLSWDAFHGQDNGGGLEVMGFVLRLYKVSAWYQEVVEMLRRVVMTSALVFVYPDPDRLASVALVVSGCFFLHNVLCRPYANPLHQAVSVQAQLTEMLLLFTVAVGQDAARGESSQRQHHHNLVDVLAGLTICMLLLTVLLPLLLISIRRLCNVEFADPLSRLRNATKSKPAAPAAPQPPQNRN